MTTTDGKGMRFDEGKNDLVLLPPEWIWALGIVMTRGAMKYERRNWERGMAWGKVMSSGLRHIFKFACGEKYDAELGCHHLAMAAWNMLVLMSYDLRKIGENDLAGSMALLEACAIEMSPEVKAAIAMRKAETR